MAPTIRPARESDAEIACEVMRRSIRELCAADHHADTERLTAWLAHQTPDNVRAWIADPARVTVVALRGETVSGFGMMTAEGEVQLCYVAPEARFSGASKGMLRALEAEAVARGLARVFLTSTVTTRAFYEGRGYRPGGGPIVAYGMARAQPMSKDVGGDP